MKKVDNSGAVTPSMGRACSDDEIAIALAKSNCWVRTDAQIGVNRSH